MTRKLALRSDDGKAYEASETIQIDRLPNNRLELTAALRESVGPRSSA